jgi:hypothetical protein
MHNIQTSWWGILLIDTYHTSSHYYLSDIIFHLLWSSQWACGLGDLHYLVAWSQFLLDSKCMSKVTVKQHHHPSYISHYLQLWYPIMVYITHHCSSVCVFLSGSLIVASQSIPNNTHRGYYKQTESLLKSWSITSCKLKEKKCATSNRK